MGSLATASEGKGMARPTGRAPPVTLTGVKDKFSLLVSELF